MCSLNPQDITQADLRAGEQQWRDECISRRELPDLSIDPAGPSHRWLGALIEYSAALFCGAVLLYVLALGVILLSEALR